MNLQHLKYVLDIYRTGSITKSAETFYIAQPNLSAALRDLENEIGIKIFIRTSRGTEPTPEGKDFITYAQSIIEQVELLESHYTKQKLSQIKLSLSSVRSSYMSEDIAHYINTLSQNSGINIHFKECTPFETINDVNEGVADLGYLVLIEDLCEYFIKLLNTKKLLHQHVQESRIRLLIKKDHPLADDPHITFDKLEPYVEVVHGDFKYPSIIEKELKKLKNEPTLSVKKTINVYDRGSLMSMLFNIHGSYIWTGSTHPDTISRHELVERFCDDVHIQVNEILIYRDGLSESEESTKLRNHILNLKKRIDKYHPFPHLNVIDS